MKLLSRKEIKGSEQSAFLDHNKLATETAKNIQKLNIFLAEIEQKKVEKLDELQHFYNEIEGEKNVVLQEIQSIKDERDERLKPIEETLDEAKEIKKQAEKALETAEMTKEIALNQRVENITTGKMLKDVVSETMKVLNEYVELIETEEKSTLVFQKTVEFFPLIDSLIEQRSDFEKEMTSYKKKIDEKIQEMDKELASIEKERAKIAKAKAHIQSQQEAIIAAKKHYNIQ